MAYDYVYESDVIDTSVDTTTVHTGRCIVRGVYINTTLSAHTVVIKDGTVSKYTIPASSTAGQFIPFGDATFRTSLVVDPDNSSTGNLTIVYTRLL